jgi:hypothetical protein
MRGFAVYLLAGVVTVLALDVVAPAGVLGLAIGAAPAAGTGGVMQYVDRTYKGDRLDINRGGVSIIGKSGGNSRFGAEPQAKPVGVPYGCEPAFSPLSASAHAENFARDCVS